MKVLEAHLTRLARRAWPEAVVECEMIGEDGSDFVLRRSGRGRYTRLANSFLGAQVILSIMIVHAIRSGGGCQQWSASGTVLDLGVCTLEAHRVH